MVFNFSEETKLFNQGTLITPVFTLCTGPAFYLFVRHLVFSEAKWTRSDLRHFAPAFLALPFTSQTQFVIAIGSLSLLAYGLASYRQLLHYRDTSNQMSSAALDMKLTWLRWVMLAFAILGITDLIRLNAQPFLSFNVMNSWYLIHHVLVLILYANLIYRALKQPLLFDGLQNYKSFLSERNNTELNGIIFKQIESDIISKQLYRKPRLTLNEVSDITGLGIRDISSAINSSGLNFCEYINGLRIEEIKKYISEQGTKKISLLEIAIESGFNSKSSFNAAFKKQVGLTPSQYLSKHRKH